jgi:hypothetical protein
VVLCHPLGLNGKYVLQCNTEIIVAVKFHTLQSLMFLLHIFSNFITSPMEQHTRQRHMKEEERTHFHSNNFKVYVNMYHNIMYVTLLTF